MLLGGSLFPRIAYRQARGTAKIGVGQELALDDVALWRLSGVDLKGLTVWDVTTDPDPASPVVLDHVQVRVGILALLRKTLAVTFHVEAYEGTLAGEALLGGEGFREFRGIKATAEGFAWGNVAAIRDKLKVPCGGTLGGDVDFNAGKDIVKDGSGVIHLKGDGLFIGPGELAVPSFGTLTLPRVDLGKLAGEIKIDDGKTSGPPITLTGNDIQGAADLPTQLRMPFDNSMVTGMFQFRLSEPFLKANPRYATVFDLTPQMKSAKDDEGTFHFRAKGPVARGARGTPVIVVDVAVAPSVATLKPVSPTRNRAAPAAACGSQLVSHADGIVYSSETCRFSPCSAWRFGLPSEIQ